MRRSLAFIATALASGLMIGTAHAQLQFRPDRYYNQVTTFTFSISNSSSQKLEFSLDAQVYSIEPRKTLAFQSANCLLGGVAFNISTRSGQERAYKLECGTKYIIVWDSASNSWDLHRVN